MIFIVALLMLLGLVSLGLVLGVRQREREVLGTILLAELPGRAWRHVGTLAIALAAVNVGFIAGLAPGPASSALGLAFLALPALVAMVVHELRPSGDDRVCGTEGVRRGWTVRSFGELEEWRLLGLHLRFRLFGEWTAVNVPPERMEAVRARLVEVAGARESTFNQ